jgi:hypothetical protein
MLHILSVQGVFARLGDDLIGGIYIIYRLLKEMIVN